MADHSPEVSALSSWLEEHDLMAVSLEPLPGDVSRRRYWRLRLATGGTAIAVWYPDDLKDVCRRFRTTTTLLEEAGVRVPAVIASECERGVMLVEDLGNETLYRALKHGSDLRLERMERAIHVIARIRSLPAALIADLCEPLDHDLLTRELDMTWELALGRSDLAGSRTSRLRLRDALTALVARLVEAQLEPCHRDFMVRNLMLAPDGSLAVIDHQDLRLGPRHYDLASLLNDSYFPDADEEERLCRALLRSAEDFAQYRRCAVQRCLKAVGTFVSFAARGSTAHLELVPPSLATAARQLARLPEGRGIGRELLDRWSPQATREIEWA